jgi:serine/threonine protein kinase, bacterial
VTVFVSYSAPDDLAAPTPDRADSTSDSTHRAGPPEGARKAQSAVLTTLTRCVNRKALSTVVVVLLATMSIGITGCERILTQSCAPSSLSPFPNGPRQTVLPITVHEVGGVAVDTAGNVYATDWGCYAGGSAGTFVGVQVVKLAPGSSTQTVLPFTGLNGLGSAAVDTAGNVYVTNASDNRVRKLGAGSHSQTVLPFTDLHHPAGVAVDRAGNVYVTDEINARVVKLAPGSNAQTVLPFSDLHDPTGVAVDSSGNVYVSDNRVVTLAPGSNTQTVLPFTGLDHPEGLAVDGAHNVYLADTRNNRVLKLPAGSGTQTLLQFSGLNQPRAVAVDNAGNVYANTFDADFGSYYVLKLAAG